MKKEVCLQTVKKKSQPIIKWSGSKRSQAQYIVSYFPQKIDNYYEPFCGGCSVARALMDSDHVVGKYFLSDNNIHLVDALNEIKNSPRKVYMYYTMMWKALKNIDGTDGKREFYNKLREKFNQGHDPYDFIVLNRLCFNGLIRYNSNGEFNSPFHLNRDGIIPSKYEIIINEWSELFNRNNVTICCCDYKDVIDNISEDGCSFVYMDPPYANTYGMYGSVISKSDFLKSIETLKCGYAFSYNGISGNDDHTQDIPSNLYTECVSMKSGNSSFKRIVTNKKSDIVYESLYIKNK